MKTLRFLLVATFLFTVFAGSAQAQGTGTEMGYIALLNQVDPSVPVRVQIHNAFEKILPLLLSGQKNGSVIEFQPEFAVGAVKIEFAAGARPVKLGGMNVFENLRDAKALMPRPSLDERAGTKAYNPHFNISLYSSCPFIYGLVSGDHVVGSLRDSTGKILAVYDDYADSYGQAWWSCFDGAYGNVLPRYKVTFNVYNSTGVLRDTYSIAAPTITFTSLDNVNSIANGKGPAGKAYTAGWYHRNLNAANTYLYVTTTGTISGTGTWSTDFGTKKFRGGDSVWIDVDQTLRFTFERSMSVPYSYCYLDYNYCGMYGFPSQAASMTITHASVPYSFTGKFSFWGSFGGSLVDSAGLPVFLEPGDKFAGTGISTYYLPNLTANVNYATNVVSGKAPANRYFWVEVYDVYNYYWYDIWAHSDASGNYSADFTTLWDLKDTEVFVVWIGYYDPASGNRTYLNQPFGP